MENPKGGKMKNKKEKGLSPEKQFGFIVKNVIRFMDKNMMKGNGWSWSEKW